MRRNQIKVVAHDLLDDRELALAKHLASILRDNKYDSEGLLEEILPQYYERRGKGSYTLEPDPIYRPLYYVCMIGGGRHFKENTREFIRDAGEHLQGCLAWLAPNPPRYRGGGKSAGALVRTLRQSGVLPSKLAGDLERFDREANVTAKHFTALFTPKSKIDERTFSILDAALAFVLMRKLSMELFKLLTVKGVTLPSQWKDFDEDWLQWYRTVE